MAAASALALPVLVAAVTWLVFSLVCARFRGEGTPGPFVVGLHNLTAMLPLVWVAAAGALVTRGWLRLGQRPHGSGPVATAQGWPEWREANIDPQVFGLHHDAAGVLGLAALAACFLFPPLHAVVRRGGPRRGDGWLIAYGFGFVAFVAFFFLEAGGVSEWLDG